VTVKKRIVVYHEENDLAIRQCQQGETDTKDSEEDIKLKYITPAIEKAGWDKNSQIRMEYTFTQGKITVRGNFSIHGKGKRADYLLSYRTNMPLAIVEAKDSSHNLGDGMQQAIEYAMMLDVKFAYSSNGSGFLEHDFLTGKETRLAPEEFPSPDALLARYRQGGVITPVEDVPFYYSQGGKTPRYYQRVAVNRTLEAIARGQERILLVMATGTGKTFTAFQIIWRLRQAGLKKKILYLADRNFLIDQTRDGDFKPFDKIMTKIRNKDLDSSYEVYMGLYQQLAGTEEGKEPFRAVKPSFFDLIVVDECHRGSARDDSQWRRILEYFSSATQIGMTATPKETKEISNIDYFGEPVYTYSLKQGIEDGFLAPYKVIRLDTNVDLQGYRPTEGTLDIDGNPVEDREYNRKDFDRNIILDDRTKKVAELITRFLKESKDRMAKTIVFCVDIEHAERMRQALVNENSDIVKDHSDYVVRITGDNADGPKYLGHFLDKNDDYPVIATTSQLLTTGCDCTTCKVIVLEANIESMITFKQIIGRGTRLCPEKGKEYFTILDFMGVSRKFADPGFDGEPVVIYDPGPEGPIIPPDDPDDPDKPEGPGEPVPPFPPGPEPDPGPGPDKPKLQKIHVGSGVVSVWLLSKRVQYYGPDGKLITDSVTNFSRKSICGEYATLDDFTKAWNGSMRKKAIIEELKDRGVFLDALKMEAGKPDWDDFDLICHIAYDQKPLTRRERVDHVEKQNYLAKYEGLAREVIAALIEKYEDVGIEEISDLKVFETDPFRNLGSTTKISRAFGSKKGLEKAIKELQDNIYA